MGGHDVARGRPTYAHILTNFIFKNSCRLLTPSFPLSTAADYWDTLPTIRAIEYKETTRHWTKWNLGKLPTLYERKLGAGHDQGGGRSKRHTRTGAVCETTIGDFEQSTRRKKCCTSPRSTMLRYPTDPARSSRGRPASGPIAPLAAGRMVDRVEAGRQGSQITASWGPAEQKPGHGAGKKQGLQPQSRAAWSADPCGNSDPFAMYAAACEPVTYPAVLLLLACHFPR